LLLKKREQKIYKSFYKLFYVHFFFLGRDFSSQLEFF